MANNQINVKAELEIMGFVENGLIAFATSDSGAAGFWGGAIGALIAATTAQKYAIVKLNDKIMIIPYESDKVLFDKAESYQKDNISKAKLSMRKFLIVTKDGKKRKVYIERGKTELKTMLSELGFGK